MGTAATENGGRWLSVDEVAASLTVSKATLYRRIAAGLLPAIKLGGIGQIRIPAAGLEEFLRRSVVRPPQAEAPAAHTGASANTPQERS